MVLRPVGEHSTAVYWRRRFVLLLALVIIVVLIARACSGGSPSTGTDAGNNPSATQSPSTPSTSTSISKCTSKQLAIMVSPPAATSTAGSPLRFMALIDVTDASPCRLFVPPAQQSWTITSGGATVWTDKGCPNPAGGVQHVIRPGGHFRVSLRWDGRASTAGCGHGSAAASGTYSVQLRLGKVSSKPAPFALSAA